MRSSSCDEAHSVAQLESVRLEDREGEWYSSGVSRTNVMYPTVDSVLLRLMAVQIDTETKGEQSSV